MGEAVMNFRVVNDYLIAELYEAPKKEGLILTVKESDKMRYKVTHIGTNFNDIKVGDIIFIDRFHAQMKEIDGHTFYVIPIDKVIAVINAG